MFYVIVYYTVALVAVVSAVRAKSVVMRALPMLVLIACLTRVSYSR